MRLHKYLFLNILAISFTLAACHHANSGAPENGEAVGHQEESDHHGHEEGRESVRLSAAQFKALNMSVGVLPRRNLSAMVEANGQLEVPPQNEATVTAMVGANIASIEVIEGDDVKKGQVLAYLSHPSLIRMQSDYMEAFNRAELLGLEYQRQKKLYEEEVGSGKNYQQIRSEHRSAQATAKSHELQLQQLGLRPSRIQEGHFYTRAPVVSPIAGTITLVEVKTGQYVQPDKDLFEIVNIEHIHADLMVFEKDVHKVEVGQRIRFMVEAIPGKELFAEIYSVGKKFEPTPKAVHIHAEIENKSGKLIPGMYIQGQILAESEESFALPEGAIVREGGQHLAFLAEKEPEGEKEEWRFVPVPVVPGPPHDGWVGIELLRAVPEHAQFALNNAYYLIAEMKKGEAEHSH